MADLRFFVVPGENGTPVIRVTSSAPVDTPSVVFLMEVNWGEGRIVREFSALVDEPLALEAAMPPPIEDAQVGPDNLIDRSGQIEAELELPTPESDQPETPATDMAGARRKKMHPRKRLWWKHPSRRLSLPRRSRRARHGPRPARLPRAWHKDKPCRGSQDSFARKGVA